MILDPGESKGQVLPTRLLRGVGGGVRGAVAECTAPRPRKVGPGKTPLRPEARAAVERRVVGGIGPGTSILPGVGLSAPLESSRIASHRGAGQKRSPREMVTARGKGAICVWCALPAPFTRQLLSRPGGSPDLSAAPRPPRADGGQPGLPSRSLGRLIFFNP